MSPRLVCTLLIGLALVRTPDASARKARARSQLKPNLRHLVVRSNEVAPRPSEMLTALSRLTIRGTHVVRPGPQRLPVVEGLATALAAVVPGQKEIELHRKGSVRVVFKREGLFRPRWALEAQALRARRIPTNRAPLFLRGLNALLGLAANLDATVEPPSYYWASLPAGHALLDKRLDTRELEATLAARGRPATASKAHAAPPTAVKRVEVPAAPPPPLFREGASRRGKKPEWDALGAEDEAL